MLLVKLRRVLFKELPGTLQHTVWTGANDAQSRQSAFHLHKRRINTMILFLTLQYLQKAFCTYTLCLVETRLLEGLWRRAATSFLRGTLEKSGQNDTFTGHSHFQASSCVKQGGGICQQLGSLVSSVARGRRCRVMQVTSDFPTELWSVYFDRTSWFSLQA